MSQLLEISISLSPLFKQFNETGSVANQYKTERKGFRSLDEYIELSIIGLVMSRPSVYLNEMCREILNCTVSPSTVCRLLKRCGVTRKKIRQVATAEV